MFLKNFPVEKPYTGLELAIQTCLLLDKYNLVFSSLYRGENNYKNLVLGF